MKQKLLYVIKGLRISNNFGLKLTHNFHELTPLEMMIYLLFIRHFWSREKRFFYEGSLALIGQMYTAERRALFEIIREKKPRHCFEIGTYTGGGSTYFLASAFAQNGSGKLITMENLPAYYNKAKNYFAKKLPKLNLHVEFILGDTPECFKPFIETYTDVDCLFLDGAEDGEQNLEQYNYFLPYFHKGSILIMHDWNTEKTRALRPVIQSDPRWQMIREVKPPLSVGLMIVEMK